MLSTRVVSERKSFLQLQQKIFQTNGFTSSANASCFPCKFSDHSRTILSHHQTLDPKHTVLEIAFSDPGTLPKSACYHFLRVPEDEKKWIRLYHTMQMIRQKKPTIN